MSLRDHRFLKGNRAQIANHKLLQDEEKQIKPSTSYKMITGIVKDVISNPYEYLRRPYDDTDNTLQDLLTGRYKPEIGSPPKPRNFSIDIKNSWAIDTMPMNSIFAYVVDDNIGKDKGEYIVCYPFFPPHLSLPLKAGEYVWITTEIIGNLRYYYWMCRKVGPRQIDDVNYTNYERIPAVDQYLRVTTKKSNQDTYNTDDVYSLKEAKNRFINKPDSAGTNFPETLDAVFKNSYSYVKEFTGEPVPRLSKNCGDLLLQGSNNAGIHLTTEKFSEPSLNAKTSFNLGSKSTSNRKALAAAVDLYVGRKNETLKNNQFTSKSILEDVKRKKNGKVNFAANIAGDEMFEYVETDKIAESRLGDMEVYDEEIKDTLNDATDVAARLYLSYDCAPDQIFNTGFSDLESSFGESIITYAQNNRVVGKENVRLVSQLGQSYLSFDKEGNIDLKTNKSGRQYLNLSANGIARLNALSKIQISQGANENITPEIEIVDGNTTITGGDVTLTGNTMLTEGGEITSSGLDINLNARQTINIAAGTISRPGTTAVLSSKVGGVKVVQNVNSQGGPLLSVKPILDFIEAYEALGTAPFATNPAKAAFLSTAGAAAPVIGTLIDSGLAKQAIEQLSTKYFYAE